MNINVPNAVLMSVSFMAGLTTLRLHVTFDMLNPLKWAFGITFFAIGLLTVSEHLFNQALAGSRLTYSVTIICFAIAVSILLGLTFIHTLKPQKQLVLKIGIAILVLLVLRILYGFASPYIEASVGFSPDQNILYPGVLASGVHPLLIATYLVVLVYFIREHHKAVADYHAANSSEAHTERIDTRKLSRSFYITLGLGVLSVVAAFQPTGCVLNNLFCWLFAAIIGILSLTFVQNHRWVLVKPESNGMIPDTISEPETTPIPAIVAIAMPVPEDKPSTIMTLFTTKIVESGLIFKSNFTQKVCAEVLCVSQSQLQKKLKEKVGFTYCELCRKYRIERAIVLFEGNNKITAKSLAIATGYKSSRVFLQNLERYNSTIGFNDTVVLMLKTLRE
jgi:AraC-like DNA-binding protein